MPQLTMRRGTQGETASDRWGGRDTDRAMETPMIIGFWTLDLGIRVTKLGFQKGDLEFRFLYFRLKIIFK